MFDNIGKKIKVLATIITWMGIIASIVLGIMAIAVDKPVIGFAIMFAGVLVSWICSFILYGFGQLVSSSESSAYYAKQNYDKLSSIDCQLYNVIKAQKEKETSAPEN